MDTRTEPGQYYPGGRVMVRPDVAPPQIVAVKWSDIEGKPDFSDIADLEDADSVGNVKIAVNKIVDKMTTAVIVLLCGLCAALSAPAATSLNDMSGTNEVYTAAETDAAIVRLAPAPGNYAAVSNAAMNAVQKSEITNSVCGIVTNTVPTGEWTFSGLPADATAVSIYYDGPVLLWTLQYTSQGNEFVNYATGEGDETSVFFMSSGVTATCTTRNALGFVRYKDLADATNNIPRPDMSKYVRVDENGAVTLKKNGSDDGAIIFAPSDGFPYPYIRVKNPNSTEAYIYVGDSISLNDTPSQGAKFRIAGNVGQSIYIGYNYEENRFIPKIVVDGTNLLFVIDAVASSNAVHSAEIAELTDQIADVAAIAMSERSWSRPGEWGLFYLPSLDAVTVVSTSISTNDYGMIYSNSTSSATQGLSASIYAESLDPLSSTEPPAIISLEITGGTASNNVVSVTNSGVYSVKALAANGETRQTSVAFSGGSPATKSETAYVADSESLPDRVMAQSYVAYSLQHKAVIASGTDGSGNAYKFYNAWQPTFGTGPGQGHFRPFAIAPSLMATAAHYPWFPAQDGWSRPVTYNYHNGQSGTYTVRGNGTHFNLAQWALTNGFLQAEVDAAGISDTEILPLQEGWYFPAEECPYFATPEWIASHYGSLYGMTVWAQTQKSDWCIPLTISSVRNGGLSWLTPSGLAPYGFRPRADIASYIGDSNALEWWRVQVGDSGKPIFLSHTEIDGSFYETRYDIILSHFHWVGGGPNYTAAARILAALCQQYNTTLRLLY